VNAGDETAPSFISTNEAGNDWFCDRYAQAWSAPKLGGADGIDSSPSVKTSALF